MIPPPEARKEVTPLIMIQVPLWWGFRVTVLVWRPKR